MNKTIKIIDLLNKIANGEEIPKKIKYDNYYCYYDKKKNEYVDYAGVSIFAWDYIVMNSLNDTIEIIEDNDKLEKIKWGEKESRAGHLRADEEIEILARRTEKLKKKIAELIDHINKLEEKLDEKNN